MRGHRQRRRPGSGEGELIVVTEDNEVFALDALSSQADLEACAWLARPALHAPRPAGNISPLGVTGAPVIDEQRATVYLDAAVMRGSRPRQDLRAFPRRRLDRGRPGRSTSRLRSAGVSTFSTRNQRGALALFRGKIFVPFSGHWGDCGAYHGFVVGVSIDEPGKVTSFSTRARAAAAYGRRAVSAAMDSRSSRSRATHSAQPAGSAQPSGATAKPSCASLRTSARPIETRDYFAPSNWRDLDRRDLDLGSNT